MGIAEEYNSIYRQRQIKTQQNYDLLKNYSCWLIQKNKITQMDLEWVKEYLKQIR